MKPAAEDRDTEAIGAHSAPGSGPLRFAVWALLAFCLMLAKIAVGAAIWAQALWPVVLIG